MSALIGVLGVAVFCDTPAFETEIQKATSRGVLRNTKMTEINNEMVELSG